MSLPTIYVTVIMLLLLANVARYVGYRAGFEDGREQTERTATLRHQKERKTTAWFHRQHSRN